jgi:hypothetical protein
LLRRLNPPEVGTFMRRLLLISACIGPVLGGIIMAYDAYFIHRYAVDYNEVAGVDSQWGLLDWETGRIPAYARHPAWTYGLGLWLFGGLCVAVREITARNLSSR